MVGGTLGALVVYETVVLGYAVGPAKLVGLSEDPQELAIRAPPLFAIRAS